MQILHAILSALTVAAFVGLLKPYIRGLGRKHFLGGMVGLMAANAATLPFIPNYGQSAAPAPAPTATPDPRPSSTMSKDMQDLIVLTGLSLKKAMRNPDSLVVESADAGEVKGLPYVCVVYRGQNGFGGMNREHAVFSAAGGDPSARAWNKYCQRDDLKNVTSDVRTFAKLGL